MTAHLRRQGHQVAACTVDRLMRDEHLSGLVRGGKHRTTVSTGQDGRRAPDLLDRDFTAAAPNRKWVTDFTYCRTWSGFVYVAFVIDCFSRAIVGWHATQVKNTALVTTALKMALWRRAMKAAMSATGLSIIATPDLNIRLLRSPKLSTWRASPHQSAASATPTITPWPSQQSACSRLR
jgi:putative transposase